MERIPNKQLRDPLLDSGIKEGGKYTAEKIKALFVTYNLVIYTPEGVYDTSKYNLCESKAMDYTSSEITGSGTSTKSLILGYNPVGSHLDDHAVKFIDTTSHLNTKTRLVVIPEATIERVIIKGKRNFLPNQNPKRGSSVEE